MNRLIEHRCFRKLRMTLYIVVSMLMLYSPVFGQQKPPKPISVTVSKEYDLNFGTFCAGDGIGTRVQVDPYGVRTKTGNIILLNSYYSAARYDVSALPGTYITLLFNDAILSGPNGASMTLQVNGSSPSSPFVATGLHTTVTIGGSLIVGSAGATPSGNYFGEFFVTFIQE
jgi:hypothetical protein